MQDIKDAEPLQSVLAHPSDDGRHQIMVAALTPGLEGLIGTGGDLGWAACVRPATASFPG